ncbi:MAG: hypothetical protein ACOZDY_05440 [Pseudomonadota bacterium]
MAFMGVSFAVKLGFDRFEATRFVPIGLREARVPYCIFLRDENLRIRDRGVTSLIGAAARSLRRIAWR